MVKVRQQPLFNRRYLMILIWVLPIVILILHRAGQQPSPLDQIHWQKALGYLMPDKRSGYQLKLILPLQNTASDEAWVANQSVERALAQRLESPSVQQRLNEIQWQARLERRSHYRSVIFHMANAPRPEQLQSIVSILSQPAPVDWSALQKRLQAERYLNSQSAEDRLLAAFGDQLRTNTHAADLYAGLWTTPLRRILIGEGLNNSDTSVPPTADGVPLSTPQAGTLIIPATGSRLDTRWELLAQPIPAPHDGASLARQRLGAELVSHLLSRMAPADADYRWLWHPLATGGYRALLLHQWTAPLPDGDRLAEQLDQALLDETRSTLLNQLDVLEAQTPEQWLDLVALYRMPLDSHTAFRATLESLNLTQARQLLTDTLVPAQSLHIRFNTAGH
ncbi:hypothetical protein ADIMK_2360 [Marinobacterium lacunae]|uniref:Uncharacterized protein n=1 Tax=Marinobacterium lacunae TaxID=1232683 RepID=A0A081FYH6_9GAMM|nr:hypothetical protein [Marinobacterium lacunae]KEA63581.1 hypothetical protein ADIMK_2360 [Marinobacterium lacunae]